MSITLHPAGIGERYSTGTENAATIPYLLDGTTSYLTAWTAVKGGVPDKVDLPNGYAIALTNIELESIRPDAWRANVQYGQFQLEGLDEFAVEFDVAAETQRITQSLQSNRSHPDEY